MAETIRQGCVKRHAGIWLGWAFAALSVALLVLLAGPGGAQEQPALISVTGEGAVAVTPDMARLSLGITAEAELAGDALDAVSLRAGELMTLLSEMGIESRDVQTSGLSLRPFWNDRSGLSPGEAPRIVGYEAETRVTIRIRVLADLGVMLDDIVANGANSFGALSFDLADRAPKETQARQAAIRDAISKAEVYAEAAGLRLGALRSITQAGAAMPAPGPRMEMAAMVTEMPIAAGELLVQDRVTVVFELEPAAE
jgi:uncharacterized protein YggE